MAKRFQIAIQGTGKSESIVVRATDLGDATRKTAARLNRKYPADSGVYAMIPKKPRTRKRKSLVG